MTTTLCQWGMLVVLTKLLSAVEVGYYSLALAITSPIVVFTTLQLRSVQVTDTKNEFYFQDYLGVRLVTNFFAMAIVAGVLTFLAGRYAWTVYSVVLLVGLNKVVEATSDISYGLWQKKERLDKVALSMIYRNIGAVCLLAILVKFTGSLVLGAASIGIFWLFMVFFFDKRNVQQFEKFGARFDKAAIKKLVIMGLPLGIVVGIMSLNVFMSRYFIEGYCGSASLGYFSAMAYVVVGVSQVSLALGQSLQARLAQYYVSNRKAFVLLLCKASAVAVFLGICIVLFGVYFGKTFLSIIYTPEYAEHNDVFTWLMIGTGVLISGSMLGYGLTAARRFKSQVPIAALVCIISFFGSWLFVPRYGMMGAAIVMLLSTVIQWLAYLVVLLAALMLPLELSQRETDDE